MITIISLFFIFGLHFSLDVTDLREEALKEGVNPLLMKLVTGENNEKAISQMTSTINSLLLQNNSDEKYLWIDLATGRTEYSFFTEKRGDTLQENRGHTERRVAEHFEQLKAKFEKEEGCRDLSNESLVKIDTVLHSKLVELFKKFEEVRIKGLLYQIIPGGQLDKAKPSLKYNGDWEDVQEEIEKNLAGYFKCLNERRTGDKLTNPSLGFFPSIWNFIKRLFGRGIPHQYKIEEPESVMKFVEKLTIKYDEELRTYADNLQPVLELLYNPLRELFIALKFEIYDSLSRFDHNQNSSEGVFNSRLFDYILELSSFYQRSNDSKSQEILSSLYELVDAFHKSLGKDYLGMHPRSPVVSGLMMTIEDSCLQLSLNIKTSLAISSARNFMSAFKMAKDQKGSDSSLVEIFLKELSQIINPKIPLINQYGLMVEVLLSTTSDLMSDNLGLTTAKILDLMRDTYTLDDELIQLMTVSRILSGFLFGQSNEAVSLYIQLESIVKETLSSDHDMNEGSEFSKLFDQKLDQMLINSKDELFIKHYPLFKIINLWGSKGALNSIKFGSVDKICNERLNLILEDSKSIYADKLGVVYDDNGKLDFSSLSDKDVLFDQVKDLYVLSQWHEHFNGLKIVRI